ncbi:MAG: excisionase family DNA-binding protein [bacterium]|nr:excisionase family DNA-binding protein [bacterium]
MRLEQFSSFQIGKMLNVSRQAVNQWIDKGFIASYRTPGGHRRVSRADLLSFLHMRSIPVPEPLRAFDEGDPAAPTLMIVDDDVDFILLLKNALCTILPQARVLAFNHGYHALMAIGAGCPDLLLLDPRLLGSELAAFCDCLKNNPLTRQLPIVLVFEEETPVPDKPRRRPAVDDAIPKAAPVMEIAERIADRLRHREGALISN